MHSRLDPDDHKLHPEAQGLLQGPDLYHRPGGLAPASNTFRIGTSLLSLRRHSRPGLCRGRGGKDHHHRLRPQHRDVCADKIIESVKAGKIRRFFLIGGCDGAKSGRNYYTETGQAVPRTA